jgi:hypothetical protein
MNHTVGEQIARLFNNGSERVWELSERPAAHGPIPVSIRDLDGNVVAYARPVD